MPYFKTYWHCQFAINIVTIFHVLEFFLHIALYFQKRLVFRIYKNNIYVSEKRKRKLN